MIPDERLGCFTQGIDLETIIVHDEIDMASELLSLREWKRKLVVDSERLADEIRDKLYPDNDGNVELVLHESLMKELDESIA